MVELGWTASKVTQEHAQNILGLGYMTVIELATCRVPEDLTSPTPTGDTSWCAQHSTSEDLVCHHTDFFVLCCSSMT
jgi:hypothetical protein